MILRAGQVGERQALEDLQRRALLACAEIRPLLLAHPDMIALPRAHLAGGHVRVAEADGVVLGFGVLLPRQTGLELEGLFVAPACWRRGVGRALVAAALAELASGGRLEAVARRDVEGFYEKLGFVRQGVVTTAFGPARRMVLSGSGKGRRA